MSPTTMSNRIHLHTVLLFVILAAAVLQLALSLYDRRRSPEAARPPRQEYNQQQQQQQQPAGTCSAATCGATDPVSDPAYNMRAIATQCVLLEEHLTVDSKYCIDCIAKHLLHCEGLATEATMLASSSPAPDAEYPHMRESAAFFESVERRWLEEAVWPERRGQDDAASRKAVARQRLAAEVREYRKRLVTVYVVDEKSD